MTVREQLGRSLLPPREQDGAGRPKYVQCGGTRDAQTVLVCGLKHMAGYSSAQHSQLP